MTDCPTYRFRRNKYGRELLLDLIRLETLEPYLRQTPCHRLTYFDITLIREGSGRFMLDGQSFPLEVNQLLFTAPGQMREWKVEQIPKGLVLIFEEPFLSHFFNDTLFVRNLSFFNPRSPSHLLQLSPGEGEHIVNLMLQIEQEIANSKELHLLRALLYQVLALINTFYRSAHPDNESDRGYLVDRYLRLIDLRYREEHAISFYARELCVSAGHLSDQVKQVCGKSAKQVLIDRQLTEGKRLLLYGNHSVTEIAWTLGFNDPSYFSRLFRNQTGYSPLAYRDHNHD